MFLSIFCWHLVILVPMICMSHKFEDNDEDIFLEYPGDVKLGALFPIHKSGEPCGAIQKEDGIQPLEAMLFTLDEINANKIILPNISLGVSAFDSCDNPIHATEKAVPLLKGFITRKVNLTCNSNDASSYVTRKRRHGSGIIGHQENMITKIPNAEEP